MNIYQETLGFYMYHNISKHISILVLFFVISVSCFVFFAGFLKIIAPRVGFKRDFSAPGLGFCTFIVPRGWGIHPYKKDSPGVCLGGGWSDLELADT